MAQYQDLMFKIATDSDQHNPTCSGYWNKDERSSLMFAWEIVGHYNWVCIEVHTPLKHIPPFSFYYQTRNQFLTISDIYELVAMSWYKLLDKENQIEPSKNTNEIYKVELDEEMGLVRAYLK